MSCSPSSSTPASTGKQTLLTSYFGLQQKRKRRNLEDAGKPLAYDAESEAVEEYEHPTPIVPATDDKFGSLNSSTGVEVERMPAYSTSPMCSSQQSDSDASDVILPSPNAYASNNSFTLSGRMKRACSQHVNTLGSVSSITVDQSEMAVLPDSMPAESSSQILNKSLAVHKFYHTPTSRRQPTVREVASRNTARDISAYQSRGSNEDEDVQNDDHSPVRVPSPSEAETDTEFSSKLPAAAASIFDDHFEDTESYSFQSDQLAARRQFTEKVNYGVLCCALLSVFSKLFNFAFS